MPDPGTAGFVTGFANSFDRGLNTGIHLADRADRREREKTAEGKAEQDRVQSDRANEAINAFDSGDPTPVVEAWNQSASKQGLPPEKAATAAEIDSTTGEVVIKHTDGTMTRKKSDQARAMLRSAYGVPARSAIPTEERDDAEEAVYRKATASLAVGEFDPVFSRLNEQIGTDGGKPFKTYRKTDRGFALVKEDGSEVELSGQDAADLVDDLYGKRRRRISDGDGETPAKPDALQKDISTQHASDFFSEWVDTNGLDPKDQEKMLSRFLEVMRDPNNKHGAIESMKAMGLPIKKLSSVTQEVRDRHAARMEAMRAQARSKTSPGGETITTEEQAEIAAIPTEAQPEMQASRKYPAGVRFAIDPNAAPGQAPAQQAQQPAQQAQTMSEQEFRAYAAEQGYPEADIEESVAEYKRQGRIR